MKTHQPTTHTSKVWRKRGGWSIRYRPDQRREALIHIAAAEQQRLLTKAECEDLVADVWRHTINQG